MINDFDHHITIHEETLNGIHSAANKEFTLPNLNKYLGRIKKEGRIIPHEVIDGNEPMKLIIDIDCPVEKWATYYRYSDTDIDMSVIPFIEEFMHTIFESIIWHMEVLYDVVVPMEDIIIEDSSGLIGNGVTAMYKFSYHVKLNKYAFADYIEAGTFSLLIRQSLYDKYDVKFINAIYDPLIKKRFNCRLATFTKKGRMLKIVSGHTFEETLVSNTTNLQILPSIEEVCHKNNWDPVLFPRYIREEKEEQEFTLTGIYMELLRPILYEGNTEIFAQRSPEQMIFDRLRPSMCPVCNRVHTKDNASAFVKDGRLNWLCFRQSSYICLGVVETENVYDNVTSDLLSQCRERNSLFNTNLMARFSNGQSVRNTLIYDEPTLRPLNFGNTNTLCVKAGMGMGKSEALRSYILENDLDIDKSVILSYRRTLTSEIARKFPEYKSYLEINEGKGNITNNNILKVIFQVESLHRLAKTKTGTQENGAAIYFDFCENVDLLIIDECESIFRQMNSPFMRDMYVRNCNVFHKLLRCSKQVIVLDADLSQNTVDLLKRRRGSVFIHHNTHKKNLADNFNIYLAREEAEFLLDLDEALNNGENIVIPSNSATKCKEIHRHILYRHRDIMHRNIKMYTGDTDEKEKFEDFRDVNAAWDQPEIRVLIYSPCLSAGVSFTRQKFHRVFAYFTNDSCQVEDCRQMLRRVRNISTREYNICFKTPLHRSREITPEEVYHNLSCLQFLYEFGGDIPANSDEVTGKVHFFRDDVFHITINNLAGEINSRSNFLFRFIEEEMVTGANFTARSQLITAKAEDVTRVKEDIKQVKKEVKFLKAYELSKARDLSTEEFEKLSHKNDASHSEKLSLRRYRLRQCYDYTQERMAMWNIGTTFAEIYSKEDARAAFYNQCVLLGCFQLENTYEQILEKMVKIEADHRVFSRGKRYMTFRLAFMLLQAFDIELRFVVIHEEAIKTFSCEELVTAKKSCVTEIKKNLDAIKAVYNKNGFRGKEKDPAKWSNETFVRFSNTILRKIGLKITGIIRNNRVEFYELAQIWNFTGWPMDTVDEECYPAVFPRYPYKLPGEDQLLTFIEEAYVDVED